MASLLKNKLARHHAERQYLAARVQPQATLAEHLEEFDELWEWHIARWRDELSATALNFYGSLTCETERDLFRIVRNFARLAAEQARVDFPVPVEHLASRLGVTFQHLSKLRQKFCRAGVLSETLPARVNSAAARYRWCL